jgi:hypothetical protein
MRPNEFIKGAVLGIFVTIAVSAFSLGAINDLDQRALPPPPIGTINETSSPVLLPWQSNLLVDVRASRDYRLIKVFVTKDLGFPFGLTVEGRACNFGPNSHYEQANRRIIVCMNSADHVLEQVPAMVFVTAHEMGHAYIETLNLTVLGREEDAADEFATVAAIGARVPEVAVAGADMLNRFNDTNAAADEHVDGHRRAFRVLCMLFGSGNRTPAVLNVVHAAKAETECISLYAHVGSTWADIARRVRSRNPDPVFDFPSVPR